MEENIFFHMTSDYARMKIRDNFSESRIKRMTNYISKK